MSVVLSTIRSNVRTNLADAGTTFYSDLEINQSIQDAYNEVAARTQCIVKTVLLSWKANANYLDFITDYSVSDYMAPIAIFNNATNQWLRDDVSIRDFIRLRRDWEKWTGTPMMWASHSIKYIAVAPKYPSVSTEQFTLYYAAFANTLVDDSSVISIADDMTGLLENYATGDLLEAAEEITKAATYTAQFEEDLVEYKQRCHNLAKHQLLLRV